MQITNAQCKWKVPEVEVGRGKQDGHRVAGVDQGVVSHVRDHSCAWQCETIGPSEVFHEVVSEPEKLPTKKARCNVKKVKQADSTLNLNRKWYHRRLHKRWVSQKKNH